MLEHLYKSTHRRANLDFRLSFPLIYNNKHLLLIHFADKSLVAKPSSETEPPPPSPPRLSYLSRSTYRQLLLTRHAELTDKMFSIGNAAKNFSKVSLDDNSLNNLEQQYLFLRDPLLDYEDDANFHDAIRAIAATPNNGAQLEDSQTYSRKPSEAESPETSVDAVRLRGHRSLCQRIASLFN